MTRAKRAMPGGVQIVPSLLAADFAHLARDVERVESSGALWLQIDVMDGHFVPNITFGPAWVRAVRGVTDLYVDAHLMITNPLRYIDGFMESGSDLITVHAEIEEPLEEIAHRVHGAGRDFGLAFRPKTDPIPFLERMGGSLELALVMTVVPGFGGQSFLDDMLDKVRAVRRFREENGLRYVVQVDGGINGETALRAARAGAESLVAGSAVFGRDDPGRAFRDLTALARSSESG